MIVEAKIAPTTALHGDGFFLVTINVKNGEQLQIIPCVVDRASSQVSVHVEGQWLAADEWLKGAPLAARLR